MKKKVIYISLLFLAVLLCSACDGDVTRDIRHAGFSVSTKFICDGFYPTKKEDILYKKIKYLTNTNIIDAEGRIYEVSFDQVYENKQNCKKASTDIIVRAIYDGKVVKATDNKYYYLISDNGITRYSQVSEVDNSYELYNILLSDVNVVKVATIDSSKGLFYVLKNDGNIYSYTVTKADYNSPLKITARSMVYDISMYNSKIVDFNYAGESSSTYIKTEDAVYRMKATNYDRCSKYADVECIYEIERDEVFDKYGDRIIAFNGNILITDYKQVFKLSN